MTANDPYSVLGLPQGASEKEAKEAFRKLAKSCHPDLHPGDPAAEQRFKEINAAYDAIRNPQPEPPPNPFREFRFGFGFANSPFDDLFGDLNGFSRQMRNPDIQVECRLTLEEAFHGKEIVVEQGRQIKLRIPAGVEDGMQLRVPQAGTQSNPSMRPGDLFVRIRVMPHAFLYRQGRDLHTRITVNVFEVMLGKEIEIEGIEGRKIRVAIPTGFDSSRKLRVAGQGMPDGAGRGDLLITLSIEFPVLADEQRKLIEQAHEKSCQQ